MSSDKPLVLRGGNDEQTALHNRIAVIERIMFLAGGINLRKKSTTFLKLLDLELWQRWYKNEPANKKADELFCQRAADVVMAMEDKPKKLDKKAYDAARSQHQSNLEGTDADQHVEGSPGDAGQTKQAQD